MFELDSLKKVRVLDVRVLSQKDRKPDELPGAQLLLQATLGAGVLAMFDGFLPGLLYRKPSTKKQGDLDGAQPEPDKVTPIKPRKQKGQASKDALDAAGNPFGTKDATQLFVEAQGA